MDAGARPNATHQGARQARVSASIPALARPRTLATALQRLAHMPGEQTHQAGNSYLGLVRQATHSHQERAALCRALLLRGHPVEGLGLTKALRRVRTTTKTIATSACGVSA